MLHDGLRKRVEMSMAQYYMLTRRPYIPLTLVAVRMLQNVTGRVMSAVMAAVMG